MEHPNGIELVDYIGGQLPAERQRQIAAHLNTCSECRRRCLEVRQNWRLLGEWQADGAHCDHPAGAGKGADPDYLSDGDVAEPARAGLARGGAVSPAELGWLLPPDLSIRPPSHDPAGEAGRAIVDDSLPAGALRPTRLNRLVRAAKAAGAALLRGTGH